MENIIDTFFKSNLAADMRAIREDSEWHREANVCEHTHMCIDWYRNNLVSVRDKKHAELVTLALLFHDVGKPMAKTEKHSESRGTYYSYPAHEKYSARIFENYYLENLDSFENKLSVQDMIKVKTLIEYHLPYEKTKPDKMLALKNHLHTVGGDQLIYMFYDTLRADAHGRISDDPIGTYVRCDEWIDKFDKVKVDFQMLPYDDIVTSDIPKMYTLIGASGSGKSTYAKNFKTFCLDDYRMKFYNDHHYDDGTYDIAWQFSVDNKSLFDRYAFARFIEMLKENENFALDTVNASVKSRRKWITEAKKHGYYTIGVEFLTKFSTVLERQHTRTDKKVPDSSVKQQYFAISSAMYGSEVDNKLIVT